MNIFNQFLSKVLFLLIAFITCAGVLQGALEVEWSRFLADERNRTVVDLALTTRIGGEQFLPEDDSRLCVLADSLSDYTSKSFEETILKMLQDKLGFNPSEIRLKESTRNSIGERGDVIFFVFNRSDELILVMKAFLSRAIFAQELSALEKLNQLALNHSATVAPLAVGKALLYGPTFYFLAETVAAGKSFETLGEELLEAQGEARAQKLEDFTKGMGKLGKALAELHMHGRSEEFRRAKKETAIRFSPSYAFTKKMKEEHQIVIPYYEIETFCEDLDKSLILPYPPGVFVYRDLNWGNVFYDAKTEQITFIDTHTFHWCLNGDGEALAPAVYALTDFQIALCILSNPTATFTAEEVATMGEIYTTEYKKGLAVEDDELAEYFFKAFELFAFIDPISDSFQDSELFVQNWGNISKRSLENLQRYVDQLNQLMVEFYSRYPHLSKENVKVPAVP